MSAVKHAALYQFFLFLQISITRSQRIKDFNSTKTFMYI